MALLLWVGDAVAILSHSVELGFAIQFVNIINGVFSFVQGYRASQATEALKKILPSYARVIREGQEEKVLAEELIPGDPTEACLNVLAEKAGLTLEKINLGDHV